MRYLNIIAVLFIASFFTSCNDEVVVYDFVGEYVGPLNCVGGVHEENGTEATFNIRRIDADQYILNIGDDLEYVTRQIDNVLTIPMQTANEGNGFDEVTLEGDIRKTETGIVATFTVSVDDEGDSTCDMEMTKK